MPKKPSPLAQVVAAIKEEAKAATSPSATLLKIINDFCLETVWDERRNRFTTKFDHYLSNHASDLAKYIDTDNTVRKGRWRASAAGKCLQQQAFEVVQRENPNLFIKPKEPPRPARQMRALFNGTFGHIRWHILFDALHEEGKVRTISSEERRFTDKIPGGLSGTQDILVEFEFENEMLRALIDFKTIRSRYFKALVGPQEDHMMQHEGYDELGYDADFWMMLYEDKDTHELKIYDTGYSDIAKRKLRKNYELANIWVDQYAAGTTPRVELPLIVTWCRYCPWQQLCLVEHPNLRELQEKNHDDEDDG